MTANEALIEKELSISSKYYGPEDFATRLEVKQFVDNMPFFETLYAQFPVGQIATINDYCDYLLGKSLASMK